MQGGLDLLGLALEQDGELLDLRANGRGEGAFAAGGLDQQRDGLAHEVGDGLAAVAGLAQALQLVALFGGDPYAELVAFAVGRKHGDMLMHRRAASET